MEAILDAGTVEHAVPRLYLTVVRPVIVTHEEKRIGAYPCSEFRVTYAIEFPHPGLGYQELTASLWRADQFVDKLSPARTFTFARDVEALRRAGLARGGSLDNFYLPETRQLIQVTQNLNNASTREREVRALQDAIQALKPKDALILTDADGKDFEIAGLPVRIRSAAEWMLNA